MRNRDANAKLTGLLEKVRHKSMTRLFTIERPNVNTAVKQKNPILIKEHSPTQPNNDPTVSRNNSFGAISPPVTSTGAIMLGSPPSESVTSAKPDGLISIKPYTPGAKTRKLKVAG